VHIPAPHALVVAEAAHDVFDVGAQRRIAGAVGCIVFMPSPAAQPSSRSMRSVSEVSACHISSWLMALAGMKLAPRMRGCAAY
jgi:hypothetical protein